MTDNISHEIIVAYSLCPLKAFLLIRSEDLGTPHEYQLIIDEHTQRNRLKYQNVFEEKHVDANLDNDGALKFHDLETDICVLSKNNKGPSLSNSNFTPTIIVGTHQISNEQKLSLLFAGYVLGKIQKQQPLSGTIVGADGQSHKVGLESADKILKPIIDTLRGWIREPISKPPQIILNKHCSLCQFKMGCLSQALKDDNLSLLDRVTAKKIRHYQKKGIFTVTQLSYLFKPRRRRKKSSKVPISFKVEIQALALRTEKIYIQELPEISRNDVEIFLDIEGIPDQKFQYLIGLLINVQGIKTYHYFWANTPEDELHIWTKMLEKVNEHTKAPIYHYGSYEPRVIAGLAKKYHTDCDLLKKRLVNLNASIYGKLYFPCRSNSLKDLGKFVGATWTTPNSSGLQSLVWRLRWEETRESQYQEMLITYNREDCEALWLLTEELSKINTDANKQMNIDFADRPKQHSSKIGKEIHNEFESILRYAHADYKKKRVSIQAKKTPADAEGKKSGGVTGHQAYQRITPSKADIAIRVMPKRICPKHPGNQLEKTGMMAEKFIINLRFTKNGCRKTVTKYFGSKSYCRKCHKNYPPPKITQLGTMAFGHAFQAWVIYQRVVLRLPYRIIRMEMEDIFNESVSEGTLTNFICYFGDYYSATEKMSLRRIMESPFVHADETIINIQGVDHYVWVFTNGTYVVFRMTETRESTIVHELFSDYMGVLISDFYGGYDSVTCKQQKCLVHLIRDLNNDLWGNPYNREYEAFVEEVKHLLVPIFEAVDKYGLKKRHLRKFKKFVDRFYTENIDKPPCICELIAKYQKRFQRYRESLFTFLELDGIPWHNNTAENAIRHLAVQRKISGSFFKNVFPKYLLLLGIAQTCKFQDKSFFKFLLSEGIDIDNFKASKRVKKSIMVGP